MEESQGISRHGGAEKQVYTELSADTKEASGTKAAQAPTARPTQRYHMKIWLNAEAVAEA